MKQTTKPSFRLELKKFDPKIDYYRVLGVKKNANQK